jgi:hypothetical protein
MGISMFTRNGRRSIAGPFVGLQERLRDDGEGITSFFLNPAHAGTHSSVSVDPCIDNLHNQEIPKMAHFPLLNAFDK